VSELENPQSSKAMLLAAAVFVAGLLVTVGVFSRLRALELARLHASLERDTGLHGELLKHKLDEAKLVTQSLGRFLATSDDVTRKRFASFVRPLMPADTEIATMAWVPLVPADYRADIERQMSAEQQTSAQIFEIGPLKKPVRAQTRRIYYPMRLLEISRPQETRPVLGFDMGSTEGRLQTLERARDMGDFAGSPPIALAGNGKPGFFIVVPVYRDDAPVANESERRAALRGFAMVVFQADRLVSRALGDMTSQGFGFTMVDLDAPEKNKTIFRQAEQQALASSQVGGASLDALNLSEVYNFGGRRLQLTFSPSNDYIQANYSRAHWLILPAGGILSFILATYLWTVNTARSRLKAQVGERTQLLAQESERYRTLFERAPEALLIFNVDTRSVVAANPKASELTGYTVDVLMTMTAEQLCAPDSATGVDNSASVREHLARALAGEELTYERDILRSDGQVVVCEVRLVKLPDPVKHLVRGSYIDITQRKLMDAELRASAQRFRTLSDAMPQIVWITRPDGWNIYFNQQWVDYTGLSLEDSHGHGWTTPFHPDDKQRAWGAWQNATQNDSDYSIECRLRRMDGAYRWWLIRGVSLHDEHGKVVNWFGTCTDIDDIKRADHELQQHRHHLEELVEQRTAELNMARKQAEAANIAKSTFLANMSHEIRTPMNAIIGLTHLLRRGDLVPRQAVQLSKIDVAANHLLSIINDILDISKIEAHKLTLEQTDFHLMGILDNVSSMITDQAKAKGLTVEVDPDSVPFWLRGDPLRLRQALLNYASNAVKFTEKGGITLRAILLDDGGDGIFVRFEVADTGIGIEPQKLASVFVAFEQADASTTRQYGGTGLGLAINRHLAELMGGEAGAQSEPGQGSTFWFTARLHRGHGVMAVDASRATDGQGSAEIQLRRHHGGARILLAEDVAVNREVAVELLHGAGLAVDTAQNGLEAVEMARTNEYDLILMDVRMPQMDGLDAARAIRAMSGWASKPILAMTANAFDDDRQACLQAGMNDFVAKPVDPSIFYSMLLKWLRDAPSVSQGSSYKQAASASTKPHDANDLERRLAAIPGLNVEQGLARLMGNQRTYLRILKIFAESQADAVNSLVEALAQKDFTRIKDTAHALASTAGNVGATRFGETALALDVAIDMQSSIDDINALCAYLIDELPPLIDGIRAVLSEQ
jgi:PAS domain S-box-containing protein